MSEHFIITFKYFNHDFSKNPNFVEKIKLCNPFQFVSHKINLLCPLTKNEWVDGEAFARFIEKLKLKILAKEGNLDDTLEQLTPKEPHQTTRYAAAQQFKSSAKSAHITSKYDVYEQ